VGGDFPPFNTYLLRKKRMSENKLVITIPNQNCRQLLCGDFFFGGGGAVLACSNTKEKFECSSFPNIVVLHDLLPCTDNFVLFSSGLLDIEPDTLLWLITIK
jgi:hypothetical protein